MNIRTFQAKLNGLGYPNAVSTPDPMQEFTPGAFGALLYRDDGAQLEIRLPDTATRHNRVRCIAVESVEAMSDEMAQAYIAGLGR